jgi:chromosome segregation ATPase
MQAILALLPDLLAQRQREILESRESHIRVKSLGTVQQTLNCRMTAFETFQRDASAQQAASEADLATLGKRQSQLESDHSAIEAALLTVQRDLLSLHSARESVNRAECEVTELAAEVRSVRSGSEAALEAPSRPTDAAEECLSGQTGEVAALRAFVQSAQKESALALERLSRGEADITRLAAEVAALRGHSEGAKAARGARGEARRT